MPPARRYDAEYQEELALRDGTRVRVRLLRPSDRELYLRGYTQLSPRSQYLRFFTAKDRLSPRELHYLVDVDGEQHFALGAVAQAKPGSDEEVGVAVARFVRDDKRPELAEPAITVADAYQNRGMGRLLLVRLVEAARERGVERFRCEVLADNVPMRELLEHLAPEADALEQDGVILVEFPIGAPAAAGVDEALAAAQQDRVHRALERLMSLAARGYIGVRRAFDWIEARTRSA